MKTLLAMICGAVMITGCDETEAPPVACPSCLQDSLQEFRSELQDAFVGAYALCPENGVVLGGGCTLEPFVPGVALASAGPYTVSSRNGYGCAWTFVDAQSARGRAWVRCYVPPPCCLRIDP